MPTFRVSRAVTVERARADYFPVLPTSLRRKMTIQTEKGDAKITVPYSPREVRMGNVGHEWQDVPRPNRPPLLVMGDTKLYEVSFSLFFGHTDERSIESQLKLMRGLANATQRLRINYSEHEGGFWRMTDLSYSSVMRSGITSEITRATVDVTFRRASDLKLSVGPVTGGVKPPPNKPTTKPPAKPAPRTHVVKKGESLWSISIKYYKTPDNWRKIADYNKLRNPNRIKPGQKLRIP